jgi:hypothetical protein
MGAVLLCTGPSASTAGALPAAVASRRARAASPVAVLGTVSGGTCAALATIPLLHVGAPSAGLGWTAASRWVPPA